MTGVRVVTKFSTSVNRRHVVFGAAGIFLAGFADQAALAEPQTFMLFFDHQSAELLPFAQAILLVIKPLIKPNSRTAIVGHADTSERGPDELSLARANAVATALTRTTLPPGATLVPSSKGTSELRTRTGLNEEEATNRYVSITIE